MKKFIISFSSDPFDQWRLSQVGGSISQSKGKPVFEFTSREQYQKYLDLNGHRYKQSNGSVG
jgi:hypothetical protein